MSELTTPPLLPTEGDKEARRRINQILSGKTNNWGSITLTANSATTTLNDSRIGINTVVILQPTTANAAAALSTLYPGTPGDKTVTLNHANNAQSDKTFLYVLVG